jgi:hypothetical protein
MRTPVQPLKGAEKILVALAVFGYLTADQIARLLFAPSSLSHVRKLLKHLATGGFVLPLAGKAMNLPLVYTLSGVGRTYAAALGTTPRKRFRQSEEQEKGHNPYFLKHTIAVTDVLIAATLLSQTHPGIALTHLYTERELKRKINVQLPGQTVEGKNQFRHIYIEPDAGVRFLITETWHQKPQQWEDFFLIEVYRTLPPAEWRFKQKIAGYVYAVDEGFHKMLFHTPALSLAVIAQTEQMATTLKRWTEEVLAEMERQPDGDWFFFCSLDVASTSPEELFLSPLWQNAFSDGKTPLLALE